MDNHSQRPQRTRYNPSLPDFRSIPWQGRGKKTGQCLLRHLQMAYHNRSAHGDAKKWDPVFEMGRCRSWQWIFNIGQYKKRRWAPCFSWQDHEKAPVKDTTRRSEYVFAQENGKPYAWIGRTWRNTKKKADIKCRFHDLRHTFASHYVMNGNGLLVLKEILGHSNLKMVERYTHLASAHKRRQINNLNGKFKISHLIVTSEKVVWN